MPDISPEITGACESSMPLAVPIRDVSPQEEIAQKVKSFMPSESGTAQASPGQAKDSPLRVPSSARIPYPASGSLPERLASAAPRHQPPVPGDPQKTDPLIVAPGSVVVRSMAVPP